MHLFDIPDAQRLALLSCWSIFWRATAAVSVLLTGETYSLERRPAPPKFCSVRNVILGLVCCICRTRTQCVCTRSRWFACASSSSTKARVTSELCLESKVASLCRGYKPKGTALQLPGVRKFSSSSMTCTDMKLPSTASAGSRYVPHNVLNKIMPTAAYLLHELLKAYHTHCICRDDSAYGVSTC